MTSDPRIQALRRQLADQTPQQLPHVGAGFEAGVLLVLRPRDDLELLIIERAEIEGDPWSGHMALPGGRRDDADADLLDTALREASEETGVVVPRDAVLGPLDEVRPGSRRLGPLVIAPFVGVVPSDTYAAPNPGEVEQALWVPLSLLSNGKAAGEVQIEFPDGPRAFPSFTVDGHVIWGLTHRILTQFLEVAHAAGIAR